MRRKELEDRERRSDKERTWIYKINLLSAQKWLIISIEKSPLSIMWNNINFYRSNAFIFYNLLRHEYSKTIWLILCKIHANRLRSLVSLCILHVNWIATAYLYVSSSLSCGNNNNSIEIVQIDQAKVQFNQHSPNQ